MSRLKVGETYTYKPVGLDMFHPKNTARAGETVVVFQPSLCPPIGTANQCYINDLDGNGLGMCNINSLVKEKEYINSLVKEKE